MRWNINQDMKRPTKKFIARTLGKKPNDKKDKSPDDERVTELIKICCQVESSSQSMVIAMKNRKRISAENSIIKSDNKRNRESKEVWKDPKESSPSYMSVEFTAFLLRKLIPCPCAGIRPKCVSEYIHPNILPRKQKTVLKFIQNGLKILPTTTSTASAETSATSTEASATSAANTASTKELSSTTTLT